MTSSLERLRQRAHAVLEAAHAAGAADAHATRMVEELVLLQTELELQQQELEESHGRLEALHEHYHQLFEAAPIGFVRLSATQLIEDINGAARRLLGIDETWRPTTLAFHAYVPAIALPAWGELLRVPGESARLVIRGVDGPLMVEARSATWRGADGGWLVALQDVSEVSEARARQMEAEEQLAEVVRQMSDGLVVVDAETGLIDEHNEAFAALTGRPGESLIGRPHEAFFVPELRALQEVALRQSLRDGSHHTHVHYALPEGGERVADVTAGVVEVRQRSLHFLVVRDETERLRIEDERRRIEARLAESQKLEALGLLAAGVAHDMNNLLTAVLAATELPPSAETLHDLQAAALRGRELTERLLAVSRRRPLRQESFDLLAVAAEVVALARRTFRREISVELVRPAGTWHVEGDPGQWHQAILNLVINARDAMKGGGRIEVRAEEVDGQRVLLVRDDGQGMPPEVLRRAFEPFFTTKGEGQGTGLGLAHVRAVVAAHEGNIEIQSEPGRGTTVRLALPRLEVAAPTPQTAATLRPGAAAGRSVLVVDDEPFVLRSTVRLLERLGWSAHGVSTAADSLRTLEHQRFDVVLTDRSMPEVTGDQLARAIRCRWPTTPLVIMTGLADDQDVEALRKIGVGAVLNKPFRTQELAAAIGNLEPVTGPPLDMACCGIDQAVVDCAATCTRCAPPPARRGA